MYAILDIEATGGAYNEEGITEIAIYRFNGVEVTDQFISLVNPERPISDFVIKLTGINNKMLRNAPKFYQIAKRIIEITENCILISHNISFDYRILQTEFRRLGYSFVRKTACTLKLSQKLIPDAPSYSLGKLARSLGIPISDRHRAQGDAIATLKLFQVLLNKDTDKSTLNDFISQGINPKITPRLQRILDELPTEQGVYYIYDKNGQILFCNMSKNIQKRVTQLFISEGKYDVKIQRNVSKVAFELTGTMLISKIKLHNELSKISPKFNTKIKEKRFKYGLFLSQNKTNYTKLSIASLRSKKIPIMKFDHQAEALQFLHFLQKNYHLCSHLVGISTGKHACIAHSEGTCLGACVQKEPPEAYNNRVQQALEKYAFIGLNFVLLDKGRTPNERSVILIENGFCTGYGFIELNYQLKLPILRNLVTKITSSETIRYYIQQHIRKEKHLNILYFNENK